MARSGTRIPAGTSDHGWLRIAVGDQRAGQQDEAFKAEPPAGRSDDNALT